ncbi:MAG: sugar kinase [Deltaproteobacteria bacterium]|nr:sugar kinase [Deltaproteobacteria bacterium]
MVGSMAFDDLEFPVPTPDAEGNLRTRFDDVVGGSATYAALAASAFAPVRVVAVVGRDFPEATLDMMRERHIDTAGIERADGLTFRWKGRYHTDLVNRDTLDTQLNVFANFRPKLAPGYGASPLVLLGNIHPALQLEVLEQIEKPELVVADTMNFWIGGEPDALARLIARIDLLIINDEEARQLSGIHNLARAAKEILTRGPKCLIIKRGEHGSLFFDSEGVFAAPALLLEHVVDPTGAGDSFAGGLLGFLARRGRYDHATMRRAMVHGTAAASFCVESVGTLGLRGLQHQQVTERVERIRRLTHVGDE